MSTMESSDQNKKRKIEDETENEGEQKQAKSGYFDIYGPSARYPILFIYIHLITLRPEIELKVDSSKSKSIKVRVIDVSLLS